jgi:hypothetical protein
MAINFPDSPVIGDRFTSNSFTYEWNGTVWNRIDTTTSFINSDTPPPNPNPGTLWYDTANLELFVYYDDGNSQQWIAVAGGTGVITPDYTANRIINGNFQITQRGTSPFTAFNTYTFDRWAMRGVGGSPEVSVQLFTTGTMLGKSTPIRFPRIAISGQSAANHFLSFQQRVENVRNYAGETVTVLGFARRWSGSGSLGVSLSQIFGTGGSPSASVWGSGVAVPLTSTWEPFAVTFALPNIVGKTIGTEGNDALYVDFALSSGTDNTARFGIGIQTITVDLWGIHILPGTHSANVALNYVQRNVADEIADCLRYYEKSYGLGIVAGTNLGTTGSITKSPTAVVYDSYRVIKRGGPTLTIYSPQGTSNRFNYFNGVDWNTQDTPTFPGTTATGFNFNTGSRTSASYEWVADAEL